ncbi:hypothetical protein ACH49Z_19160 [Nocardia testacea]|uniref:Uncharacterized protein n=1 Tax=Nocardia testacea TaxID=248551 RepID=A0ABW7VZI1_9NOCA
MGVTGMSGVLSVTGMSGVTGVLGMTGMSGMSGVLAMVLGVSPSGHCSRPSDRAVLDISEDSTPRGYVQVSDQ